MCTVSRNSSGSLQLLSKLVFNILKTIVYIYFRQLAWLNDNGEGFTLDYPAISLHAISRDTSSFPHQCLYLMLDVTLGKLNLLLCVKFNS